MKCPECYGLGVIEEEDCMDCQKCDGAGELYDEENKMTYEVWCEKFGPKRGEE